jgi:hypothetical protein
VTTASYLECNALRQQVPVAWVSLLVAAHHVLQQREPNRSAETMQTALASHPKTCADKQPSCRNLDSQADNQLWPAADQQRSERILEPLHNKSHAYMPVHADHCAACRRPQADLQCG